MEKYKETLDRLEVSIAKNYCRWKSEYARWTKKEMQGGGIMVYFPNGYGVDIACNEDSIQGKNGLSDLAVYAITRQYMVLERLDVSLTLEQKSPEEAMDALEQVCSFPKRDMEHDPAVFEQETMIRLAKSEATAQKTLKWLLQQPDIRIRRLAAANPHTPEDAVYDLYCDEEEDETVKKAAEQRVKERLAYEEKVNDIIRRLTAYPTLKAWIREGGKKRKNE